MQALCMYFKLKNEKGSGVMIQNRFKSKVLWVSILTQAVALLVALDIIDIGTSDLLNKLVITVCELFVIFGILNNPTASNSL